MTNFELTEYDLYAIEIAKNVARKFLTLPNITPQQIIDIGGALTALEKLPKCTKGAFSTFGLSYRNGTDDFEEMRYITFAISEAEFEISIGGSVYDKAIGSDSFVSPGWFVDVNGNRADDCQLAFLEDEILEYLNLGAKIRVNDF